MKFKICISVIIMNILFFAFVAEANNHYEVKKGDTIWGISQKFDVNYKKVIEVNKMSNPGLIYPGDTIIIPKKKKDDSDKKKKYEVKKGDTIWGISQKFDVNYKKVIEVNKVSNPGLIYPGDEIIIPNSRVFHWENPGGNPFTGSLKKGLSLLLDSPPDIIIGIIQEIDETKPIPIVLKKGNRLRKMVFGKNKVNSHVICDFNATQSGKKYITPTLKKLGYILVIPDECGNYSLKEISQEEKRSQENFPKVPVHPGTSQEKKRSQEKFPEVPVHPGTSQGEKRSHKSSYDKVEVYVGGGISEPTQDSGGSNVLWSKIRFFPFFYELKDSIDIGCGLHVNGYLNSGKKGSYIYKNREWSFGPSIKLLSQNWDADFDLGVGELFSKGSEGKYESEQLDKIVNFSVFSSFYKRRNEGKKWFPETNFGMEATIPFKASQTHEYNGDELPPNPWDNQDVKLFYKQDIYDFFMFENFRIIPGIRIGLGHNWGEASNYYEIGPKVSLGHKGRSLFELSAFNYKGSFNSDADNVTLFSLSIDVINAWKEIGD